MAESEGDVVENALECLVSITERSGNLRNDLKKELLKAVSTLRKEFINVKNEVVERNKRNVDLERELLERKEIIKNLQRNLDQVAPSLIGSYETPGSSRQNATPSSVRRKPYSEAARANQTQEAQTTKRYKLFVKTTGNESPEEMRHRIKRNINPTDMKVGITSMKSLRDGRLIIECEKKEEIDIININITEKCGQHVATSIPKLRNPYMVIYNIPEEMSINNADTVIRSQNEEIMLKEGDIKPKFIYKNKRKVSNLVMEVNSQTRKQLLDRKLKVGWHICRIDDYQTVKRCFKCSKFGHRAAECKGEETCPICADRHKLKDCTASQSEVQCANCLNHNKYNPKSQRHVKHTSFDKNCPSLKEILNKYRQNTDY